MRVLTCLDAVPAADGTCATTAYQELPSPWPKMTVADGQAIGQQLLISCVGVLVIKLFLKPSTHKQG